MMSRATEIGIAVWLVILTLAGALSIYEITSILPDTPSHTISYYAHKHHWIGYLIIALVTALVVGFDFWFVWHIHQGVSKLHA